MCCCWGITAQEIQSVDLVQSNSVVNNSFLPLLNDCRSLLSNFHQVRVGHTFREANRCADALARRGCSLQEDFVTTDANGMYYQLWQTCYRYFGHYGLLVFLMQFPFNQKKKFADKYWLRNDLFIMYSWTVGPISVEETCRVQRIYLYYVFIFEIKFYKDTV